MVSFKLITVDGERRLAVYVDGRWVEDIEIFSGFSVAQAKKFARTMYSGEKKRYYLSIKGH